MYLFKSLEHNFSHPILKTVIIITYGNGISAMCDYDIYALPSRFYMDQVPLDLLQSGKVSLNPKGAGFRWITGADKKSFFFHCVLCFFFKNF